LGNGGVHDYRDVVRSSAMSDTSEAPSLASHVRRVRVPSQASGTQNQQLFLRYLERKKERKKEYLFIFHSAHSKSII
jgi:myosin-15